VAKHAVSTDCWTAIGTSPTNVYNLTPYISTHPGGVGTISALCGTNGTTAFTNKHGSTTGPANALAGLKIGVLV
jgi:cytochrome b involved in lipid metabolism